MSGNRELACGLVFFFFFFPAGRSIFQLITACLFTCIKMTIPLSQQQNLRDSLVKWNTSINKIQIEGMCNV